MSIGARWHAHVWVLFALIAPFIAGQATQNGCNANGPRVPCGSQSIESADCLSQGCCYEPAPGEIGGTYLGLPACFTPNGGPSNYAVRGSTLQTGADGTQQASLDLQGNGTMQALGSDISPITLSVQNVDQNILRVKMGANGRFEVPGSLFQNTGQGRVQGNPNYGLQYSASPFGFAVTRVGSSTAALFNTAGNRIVFKDQYLELTTSIPSSATLFGLGEFTTNTGFPLRRDGLPYTLWARDQPPAVPNINLYGSHPIIFDVRDGGLTHGVMLMNSNGMDVVLTSNTLQFRAIGGILDFYFLLGPSPMDVLNQFTSIVGRPVMPPYWSLGLMQSKDGYDDIQYCEQVVANYIQNQIPLETFVTDIQYLKQNQDFTLSDSYPLNEFQTFVARLHNNSQRWVPILDPQIHVQQGYAPHDQGIAEGVFIKDMTGQPYNGQLWPGAVNFPDFFAQQTIDWWTSQIQGFNSQLPLDGLWIDMHEPSNFCTGDICVLPESTVDANTDFYCKLTCTSGTGASPNATFIAPPGIYDPPYKINNNNTQLELSTKTVPLSGRHLDGNLSYDLHNLYGLSHSIATYKALTATLNRRPFVLSRSTFLGSGAWTAHWTGDTQSDWNDLQWSIGAGMAGISFVGADICGFNDYATEELCARWAAAGAWQPFARNHHADGFQEFYTWPTVTTVAQKAFTWRLRVLPYHYSAFFDSHTYGCSVMRPLYFPFPGDVSTYYNNYQWMLGDALLVAPILSQGTSTLSAYFPQGIWYNLYNYSATDTSSGGQNITVQAQTTDDPPVFILGGNIVPIGANGTNNTDAARAANLTLLAALPGLQSPLFHRCGQGCAAQSSSGSLVACGHMYLDQGEEVDVGTSQNNYLAFEVRVVSSGLGGNSSQGSLVTYWPGVPGQGTNGCSASVNWPILDNVTILGVPAVNTESIAVQDIGAQTSAAAAFGAAGVVQAQQAQVAAPSSLVFGGLPLPSGDVAYDSVAKVLSITNLGYQLTCPNALKITWQPPTSSAPSGLGVDGYSLG